MSIFSEEVDGFLEHHGVKGMKWGKRGGSSRSKESSDRKKVSELKKRNPKTLSDKQIRAVNQRLNLEQQFSRLNPGKAASGKAAVQGLLATAGVGVAVFNLANSAAGKAAMAAGKKAVKK